MKEDFVYIMFLFEVILINGKYRLYTNLGIVAEADDGIDFQEIGFSQPIMDPTVFEINGK